MLRQVGASDQHLQLGAHSIVSAAAMRLRHLRLSQCNAQVKVSTLDEMTFVLLCMLFVCSSKNNACHTPAKRQQWIQNAV